MIDAEANSSRPDGPIAILMGTFNGAEYLDEQLQSLAAQTFRNWSLHVSDDGSSDSTCDIVRRFAASVPQRVTLRGGPQTGFVDNFLALARDQSIDSALFAFCDQDDVWHPDKMERAHRWFASLKEDAVPAVYLSRTELVDHEGAHLGYSPLFQRPPTFRNALVQSIGGANTMVFNRAARQLLQDIAGLPAISHDWTLYLLVAAVGGVVHYDSVPTLKYRQHGSNLVGANRGLHAITKRAKLAMGGTLGAWNSAHERLLARIARRLTPENRETLSLFSHARAASLPDRLLILSRSGVYRQSRSGTLGLMIAALLGKI